MAPPEAALDTNAAAPEPAEAATAAAASAEVAMDDAVPRMTTNNS